MQRSGCTNVIGGEMNETVERTVVLPHAREDVWAALVDDRRLSMWLGGDTHLDPRPGGAMHFQADEGEVRTGRVRSIDEPERLVIEWWSPDDLAIVEFALESDPAGTRLRVTETRMHLEVEVPSEPARRYPFGFQARASVGARV